MDDSLLFHNGNRSLQDQFQSRRVANRLEELARRQFSDSDRTFIEDSIYFFLATADADGQPDVSFKGGPAGFVQVTGPAELAFPTTMATACSRVWVMSPSIRISACCSLPCTGGPGGCGCWARRASAGTTRCSPGPLAPN